MRHARLWLGSDDGRQGVRRRTRRERSIVQKRRGMNQRGSSPSAKDSPSNANGQEKAKATVKAKVGMDAK